MKINQALGKIITITLILAMAISVALPLSVFAQPGELEASVEPDTSVAPENPAEENPQEPVLELPITEENVGGTNTPGESESVDLIPEEKPEVPNEIETASENSENNNFEEPAGDEFYHPEDESVDENEEKQDDEAPIDAPIMQKAKMQPNTGDIVVADWIRLRNIIEATDHDGFDATFDAIGNITRITIYRAGTSHESGTPVPGGGADWITTWGSGSIYNLVISESEQLTDLINSSGIDSAINVRRTVTLATGANDIRLLHPQSSDQRHFVIHQGGNLALGGGIILDGQRPGTMISDGGVTINSGGGVTINSGGTLEMDDGSVIRGNRGVVDNAGGVQINDGGTFTMRGGEVNGNSSPTAGSSAIGVVMQNGATINVGGNARIGNGPTISNDNNTLLRDNSDQVINILTDGFKDDASITIHSLDTDITGTMIATREDGGDADKDTLDKFFYTDSNYNIRRQEPGSSNVILYGLDWVRLRDIIERQDDGLGTNQVKIHPAYTNRYSDHMDWIEGGFYNFEISDSGGMTDIINNSTIQGAINVTRQVTLSTGMDKVSIIYPLSNTQRHFVIGEGGHLTLGRGIILDGQRVGTMTGSGGGVAINKGGTLEMLNESVIINNRANNGTAGGVQINNGGTFTMKGGLVVDNHGQTPDERGVLMMEGSTMNFGGRARIGHGAIENDSVSRNDSNLVINILNDGLLDGAILTMSPQSNDAPGTMIARREDGKAATIGDLERIAYVSSDMWPARQTKDSPNIVLGWQVIFEMSDNITSRIFSRIGHENPYKYGTAEWPEAPLTKTTLEDVRHGIIGWFTKQSNFTQADQKFENDPVTENHSLWPRKDYLFRISVDDESHKHKVTVTSSSIRLDESGTKWAPEHTEALSSIITMSAEPPPEGYKIVWTVINDRTDAVYYENSGNSTNFKMPAFGVTIHAEVIEGDVEPFMTCIDFGKITRPTFTPLFFTLGGSKTEEKNDDVLIGTDASHMEDIIFKYPSGFNIKLDLIAGPFFQINEDGEYVENEKDPNSQVFTMVAWENGNRKNPISPDLSGNLRVKSIFEGNGETSWTWSDLRHEILISLDAFHTLREPLGSDTEARYRSVFTWLFSNIP
ncbi:MAG: hypothetical protein FWC13_06855 [Oscillospiraceae bacterium]|nr:hypothetical protein [Oscillospiraceae bacterium]